MSQPFTLRRRTKETIDVVSPFPEKKVRPHPRYYERLRGLFGLSFLVIATGVVVAASIGLIVLAMAVFVATTFN